MTNINFSILHAFFAYSVLLTSGNCDAQSDSKTKEALIDKSPSKGSKSSNNYRDFLPKPTFQEEKIVDKIMSLPEVKKRQKYVETQTKGTRHLTIWIASKPTATNNYFWIKVGEDNGMNLVTHFNFYVYPATLRIMYLDIQNDKLLSINQWRRLNGL